MLRLSTELEERVYRIYCKDRLSFNVWRTLFKDLGCLEYMDNDKTLRTLVHEVRIKVCENN